LNSIEIEKSVLGKAVLIFILLIIAAFSSGVYIGKNVDSSKVVEMSSEEFKEQLSACSDRIQKITSQYSSLRSLAQKRKILLENGSINENWRCSKKEVVNIQKTVVKKQSNNDIAKKNLSKNREKVFLCLLP